MGRLGGARPLGMMTSFHRDLYTLLVGSWEVVGVFNLEETCLEKCLSVFWKEPFGSCVLEV